MGLIHKLIYCLSISMVLTPLHLGAEDPLVRDTVYGKVVGVADASGTWSWKGIPFAKAPLGELRWRAPLEPEAWSQPRAAKAFASASAQVGRLYGPGLANTYDASIAATLNQAVGSEDSLYLNIWRPATAATGLPVLCFIHGGSNNCGYTADPVYNGAALAKAAGAVVVTANYRLGVLGWLALPQLRTGDALGDSGNFGTLDQLLALKFIQRNIARFGGDPGNVTLMGESAGALDSYALLTSPLVAGAKPPLFHRAILMSGGLALPSELPPGCIPLLKPAASALAQGNALLQSLLLEDGLAADWEAAAAYVGTRTDAQLAAYLRSKTPEALFKQVVTRLTERGLAATWHIPDGKVVADSPLDAIQAGRYLKVPLLIGNTRDETKLFPRFLALSPALGGVPGLTVNDAALFKLIMDFKPDGPATLAEKDLINPAYLPADAPGKGYTARFATLNQYFFIPNRDAMLKALSAQQSTLWVYRFDWDREPAPWNVVFGAAHSFDLPFVFGTFGPALYANAMGGTANQGGRLALSAAMMGAVAAFARTGDPNHPGLGLTWPVWPKVLLFDATLTDKKLSVP